MSNPQRLRLLTEILSELAYDQDPPSGYFEHSLDTALGKRNMSRDELDALAEDVGIDWRCQDEPADPATLCKDCGGWFRSPPGTHAMSLAGACCCAQGAKIDEGAYLRWKPTTGKCLEKGCDAAAHCDGWCDEHSAQFKRFGTHYAVGPHGSAR